jgi:hypothetical protein
MDETLEGYEEVFLGAPLADDGEAIFHRVTTESRADHSNEYKRNMILHLQKFDRAKIQGYLKATGMPVPNLTGPKWANWSEKQAAEDMHKEFKKRSENNDGVPNETAVVLSALADLHEFFMVDMKDLPLATKAHYASHMDGFLKRSDDFQMFPNKKFQSVIQGIKSHVQMLQKRHGGFGKSSSNVSGLSWARDTFGHLKHWEYCGNDGTKLVKGTHIEKLVEAFHFHKSTADNSLVNEKFFFSAIERYLNSMSNKVQFVDPADLNNLCDVNISYPLGDLEIGLLKQEFQRIAPTSDGPPDTKASAESVENNGIRPFNGVESPEQLKSIILSLARYRASFESMRMATWKFSKPPNHAFKHSFFLPGTEEANALYVHEANFLVSEMKTGISSYDRTRRNDDNVYLKGVFRTDKVNPNVIKTPMKFHDRMLEWGQRLLYGHNVFTKYSHSHCVQKLQTLTKVEFDEAFCALIDSGGVVGRAEEALKDPDYLRQIKEVTEIFDVDALIDSWQQDDHENVSQVPGNYDSSSSSEENEGE